MALSGGAIAAIVISIYAIAVTIVLVFCFLKVKKLKKKNKQAAAKPNTQVEAPKPSPSGAAIPTPFNFVQVEYRNEQLDNNIQNVPKTHVAPVTRHQRNESVDGLSFGSVISHSEGETPHVEAKFVDPVGYLSAKSDSDSDDTLYGDVVAHTPKLKTRSGEKKVSISSTPSNDFYDVKELEPNDKSKHSISSGNSGEITLHEEPMKESHGQKANTLPMIQGQADKDKYITGSLPTLRASKPSSSSSSSSSSAKSSPELRPKTGSQIDRENARRSYHAAPEQYRKESSYLDPPAEVVDNSYIPIVPTENNRKSSFESQSNIARVGNPTSRPSSDSSSSDDEADGEDVRAEIPVQRKSSSSSLSSNENVKTMIPVNGSDKNTHYSSDSESSSGSPQIQPKSQLVRKDSETSSISTARMDFESEEEPKRVLEKNFTSLSSLESSSSFKIESRQEYRVRSSYSNTSDSEAETSKPPPESLFTRVKNAFSFRLGSEDKPQVEVREGPEESGQQSEGRRSSSSSSSSDEDDKVATPGPSPSGRQVLEKMSSSSSESEPEIKNPIQNATINMERVSLSSSSESDEEPQPQPQSLDRKRLSSSSSSASEKSPVKLMLKRDSTSSSEEELEIAVAPKVGRKVSSSSSSSNGSLPKFTPKKSSFSSPSTNSLNALHDFIVMEKCSSDGDTLSISSRDSLVNEQKVIPFITSKSPPSNKLVNNSLNLDLEPSTSNSDSGDNNLNGMPKLAKKIPAFERKSSESDSSDEDEADRAFHTVKKITEPSKPGNSTMHNDSDSISSSSSDEDKMPKDNIRNVANLNQKAFTIPLAVKVDRNVRPRRSSSTSSSSSGSRRNKRHSDVFHYDEKNRDSILRDLNLKYESVYPSRRASFLDKPQSKPDKSKTDNIW